MSRPLLFLNLAHAYDHFFLLIFPTAVLALAPAWGMSYGEALAFGTAAFVTFGLGTLPVGWLGDRWSRTHLMTIFFVGIGASAILTGLAQGPVSLTLGLGLLG
ncbi:MAG TPA: MFS transporter, partial [Geminicoccaceae bacterium]|nr:MFS transporter [Geminicoccaceae bacterium]